MSDYERLRRIQAYLDDIPAAPLWKRLPIIRHIRAIHVTRQIVFHYNFWRNTTGALPVNAYLDFAMLAAIWRGEK